MSKLITYAYLKKETDISDSTETMELDNPIKWAQDQLKFLLGRQLFDEIETQAITNPTTFSTNNAALFDPYVKQFLAWAAYADFIVKAGSFQTRAGIRIFKDETSDPASDGFMNMLIKKGADKAQFYKGEMINYILEQQRISSSNFPLYTKDCSNQKFGNGFGISGVRKISTSQRDITKKTIQNGG